MSAVGYTILAYAIGLGLLWGYAATLWLGASKAEATDDNGAEGS